MKTCSTCKHYGNHHIAFMCNLRSLSIHEQLASILSCEEYVQKKREPLKLDCECEWIRQEDELQDVIFIRPTLGGEARRLWEFEGKRTKMTLEEIVDEE